MADKWNNDGRYRDEEEEAEDEFTESVC